MRAVSHLLHREIDMANYSIAGIYNLSIYIYESCKTWQTGKLHNLLMAKVENIWKSSVMRKQMKNIHRSPEMKTILVNTV